MSCDPRFGSAPTQQGKLRNTFRYLEYRVHMTNPNPKTLTLNPFPFRELTVRLDRARAYLSVSVPFTHTTSSVHGGGAAWDRRALTRHEVAPLDLIKGVWRSALTSASA